MFINLSNHPSDKWSDVQKKSALEYGNIVDIPFPSIDPEATKEDLEQLADQYINQIQQYTDISAVMVQGEMCFTFMMVQKLKQLGIKVVCACSKRDSVETIDSEGKSIKTVTFKFVQFREY